MPNPLAAADAFLVADTDNLPDDTTFSVDKPEQTIDHVHVQYAWDGTPTDARHREDAAVRFTVWAPKLSPSLAADVAHGLRERVLRHSAADVSRVDRGAGRLPGFDSRLHLPFCTFTVTFVLRNAQS